jgi:cholesterol transport system auxiliary component
MRLRLLLTATFAGCLVACAIGRPLPAVTTYNIEPPVAKTELAASRHSERLQVQQVRVAAPYDRLSLVYRMSEVRYVSDPYHAFLADPGPLLCDRIAEWLSEAGLFKAVSGPGDAASAPLVLEATVTELYGDFRPGAEPAAVMSVEFALIDQTSAHQRVIYQRSINRRIRVVSDSPEALVGGYGSALGEILSQLAVDLSTPAAP